MLVRTHKQGKLIKEALSTLRIASVELSQDSVFESQDAQALEAVLAAIHQPDNPALVRNAMATEIMGLDAQAIANHFAEAQALDALIERFMTYRDLWRADGFIVMFRRFLEQETLAARMLLRQDGERRLTNLLHLGELLHEAAQHETTPEALIAWLCKQRLAEVTPEVAQVRLESDRQLVQIITIHKSKGLEFPIVFCPFLWDSTSSTSSVKASAYAFDDRDAAAAEARKRQAVADSAAEAVRMIYVALTRAVHRCYLVAGSYLSGTTRQSGKRSGAGLLNWLVIGGDRNPEQWLFDDSSDDDARKPQQILSAWQRLASVQHLHMALMPIPQSEARAFVAIRQGLEALAEIPRMQRPGWSWRMSSYSAMTRQLEERERDHDEQGSPDEDILAEDDMLAFPKGPHVGSFLHQIFETIAFDQPNTWPQAIRHAIEGAAALHASAPQDFELQRWQQTLMTMLKQVLDRDLGGGLVLASIGAERRLSELEFTLPMADGQTA
ncbi:MAG: exodeoxyribonuclease V subunit beta, partial [Betaproteobacteria bacterium]|nr:exodeoxyribonuclease V subunit beta [Betaproteobacteria bacterium]